MSDDDCAPIILRPRDAPVQVVVIPIHNKTNKDAVNAHGRALVSELVAAGIRADGDFRDLHKAGWKFNKWEDEGVPMRIEFSERDVCSNRVILVRHDTREKRAGAMDHLARDVQALLDEMDCV